MNKLNCGCTQDPSMLTACNYPAQCPDGELNNPNDLCSCQAEDIVREFFPSWASTESITLSLGVGEIDPTDGTYVEPTTNEPEGDDYQICPWDFHTRDCLGQDLYWNEYACQCLATETCWEECPEGLVLDPREWCSCVDPTSDASVIVYPADASEALIQESVISGLSNLDDARYSDVWPVCDNYVDC